MEIKYKPTQTDQVLVTLAITIMACLTAFVIYAYSQLPESIPTHFGLRGEPDAWGSKKTIFLLPVIGWGTIGLMALFMNLPQSGKYNSSLRVKPENKGKLVAISARSLRVAMLTVAILFGMLTVEIYLIAMGRIHFGAWYMILSLLIVIGPMGYYIIKAFRLR